MSFSINSQIWINARINFVCCLILVEINLVDSKNFPGLIYSNHKNRILLTSLLGIRFYEKNKFWFLHLGQRRLKQTGITRGSETLKASASEYDKKYDILNLEMSLLVINLVKFYQTQKKQKAFNVTKISLVFQD